MIILSKVRAGRGTSDKGLEWQEKRGMDSHCHRAEIDGILGRNSCL